MTGDYDVPTRQALTALVGAENLLMRFDEEQGLISGLVVDPFRSQFSPTG